MASARVSYGETRMTNILAVHTLASTSRRTQFTVGVAAALATGAMFRYPGGTALDATTSGYSLSRNFLSDLGMTVAYDGQPNRLGAALFVLSLIVLVVGLGYGVLRIARTLSVHPAARPWARAAMICGLLAGAAFTGVAFTPENSAMDLHVAFTFWGWRIMPLVAACLALASYKSPAPRPRVAVTWLIVAVLLAGYAALLDWGPSVRTADGLVVQVVAQKAAAVTVIVALLIVAHEIESTRASVQRVRAT